MDAAEQRSLIRLLAKELKAYSRELAAYQLFAHLLKKAGYEGIDAILDQARKSPELQKTVDKNFEGFDELLPPPDPDYEERVQELLSKWKPKDGSLN